MTDKLEALLKARGINMIHVGQFDYSAIFRERRLGREQFLQWARAPRFANTVSKWDSADSLFGDGPHLTEPVQIDLASLRPYPHEAEAGLIVADFSGESAPLMPRNILREQIARAERLGYGVKAAFEFEVIFLEETARSLREGGYQRPRQFAPDNKCWSGQTAAQEADFVAGLDAAIRSHDIALFGVSGELGPGCFEATLGTADGLRAADDAALFRQATRTYARQRSLTASFMPFMGQQYPGLGGHLHLSLYDLSNGANLFQDSAVATNALARSFIGGMVELVPQAFAMCAHTVNAYRRLAPGSWAPKSLTWADWTFTTAVRSAPSSDDSARLEFRLPGADCNPHLTLAMMLGAGLGGIERRLEAPPPAPNLGPDEIQPGAVRFPSSLAEAATSLEKSNDARRLFGAQFVEHFATACRAEHASLARAVSLAEMARYVEG